MSQPANPAPQPQVQLQQQPQAQPQVQPQQTPTQPQPTPQQIPVSTPTGDLKQDTINKLQAEVQQLQQQRDQQEGSQKEEIKAKTPQEATPKAIHMPGQPATAVSGRLKEQKDAQMIGGAPSPEHAPVVERSSEFEAPPEVQPFVEIKPDPVISTLPTPVEDEFGDILLKASNVAKPNITLPMEEEEIKKALHHRVANSVRWLGEWCKRVIKVYPKRVFFKQNQQPQDQSVPQQQPDPQPDPQPQQSTQSQQQQPQPAPQEADQKN